MAPRRHGGCLGRPCGAASELPAACHCPWPPLRRACETKAVAGAGATAERAPAWAGCAHCKPETGADARPGLAFTSRSGSARLGVHVQVRLGPAAHTYSPTALGVGCSKSLSLGVIVTWANVTGPRGAQYSAKHRSGWFCDDVFDEISVEGSRSRTAVFPPDTVGLVGSGEGRRERVLPTGGWPLACTCGTGPPGPRPPGPARRGFVPP